MQAYGGFAPFVPLGTPTGFGIWPTPQVATTDPRSAAVLMAAVESAIDRGNWLGHRTIDWRAPSGATYTPEGTVKFNANGTNGWEFACRVAITGLMTVSGSGDVQFATGTSLDMATGTSAQFHGTVIVAATGSLTVGGPTTLTDKLVHSGPGAFTAQRRSTFTHGTISDPSAADFWKVDGSGNVTLAYPVGTQNGVVTTVYMPAGHSGHIDVGGVTIGRHNSPGAIQVTASSLPAFATFLAVSGSWECVAASSPTFTGDDPIGASFYG